MIYRLEVTGGSQTLGQTPSSLFGRGDFMCCTTSIPRTGHPIPGPFHPLVHR